MVLIGPDTLLHVQCRSASKFENCFQNFCMYMFLQCLAAIQSANIIKYKEKVKVVKTKDF